MRENIQMSQAPAEERVRSQKGSVLVEFAFILPVFLLILFGVITFSVALYNKTVLTMASREGARAGALFVANSDENAHISKANATALQACQNNLISFATGMTPSVSSTISGDVLTVTASVNYSGIYVLSNFLISSQTSMRLE